MASRSHPCRVEPRRGGAYDFHMRGAGEEEVSAKGTLVDVVEPERREWIGW